MKLECVYSSEFRNPRFIEGNTYEVISGGDGGYCVVTEKGKKMCVPLNGKIWRFRIVRDKQEENKEREDILFEIESLINQVNNELNKLKKLI